MQREPELPRNGHMSAAVKGPMPGAHAGQPISEICEQLQEFGVQRRGYIRAKNAIDLRAKALVRRALAWEAGQEEVARKAVNARAGRIVDAFFAGKAVPIEDAEIVGALGGQLSVYRASSEPLVAALHAVEKEMVRLARTLPAYAFVKSVHGFGDKAFAVIVGEAGDLGAYPKKGHLWKRLGLAPFEKDGVVKACSTWAREGGLSADDWTQAGYKRQRLAEVFSCLADPMAKGKQIESGAKSGTDYGRPLGPYGEIYVRRREVTAQRYPDWPRSRARSDALRIMSKAVIRDLWRTWRIEGKAIHALLETVRYQVPSPQPNAAEALKNLPENRVTRGVPPPQQKAA